MALCLHILDYRHEALLRNLERKKRMCLADYEDGPRIVFPFVSQSAPEKNDIQRRKDGSVQNI